jgi:hypothetical protein
MGGGNTHRALQLRKFYQGLEKAYQKFAPEITLRPVLEVVQEQDKQINILVLPMKSSYGLKFTILADDIFYNIVYKDGLEKYQHLIDEAVKKCVKFDAIWNNKIKKSLEKKYSQASNDTALASKRVPTQPDLWARVLKVTKGLQKKLTHNDITIEAPNDGKGFTKYPSAYANAWASKMYKKLGGKWKTVSDLRKWLEGHGGGKSKKANPKGDWVAIAPRDMTVDDEKFEKGDILGPCGVSRQEKFKKYTKDGKEPFKCMPRKKAYQLGKEERGRSAERKRRAQKKRRHTKKPVWVET